MDSIDALNYALSSTDWKLPVKKEGENMGNWIKSGITSKSIASLPHSKETVLNKKDTEEILKITNLLKGDNKMSQTPTKVEYEKALETVEKYEKRQADLAKLNKDLGYHLQQFAQFKFEINEDKKEVTFTGVTEDGKLKLEKSVARSGDIFEDVIGKLVCVLKALGKDIGYVDKYVEKSGFSWEIGGVKSITIPDMKWIKNL